MKNIPLLNLLVAKQPLRRRIIALILLAAIPVCISLFHKVSSSTALERIQKKGYLIVATRNSPTTYYQGSNGETGFEYDLMTLFAEQLGVELKIKIPERFTDVLPMVAGRSVDLAAAGISVTQKRKQLIDYGPSYLETTPQLIYRSKQSPHPKKIADTQGYKLEVIGGSSHEELLIRLKDDMPELHWIADPSISVGELIRRVEEGKTDYAIADSNDIKVNRRFMPELRVAFNIGETEDIAWAFPKSNDTSVIEQAQQFFTSIKENGVLTQLIERHFGHITRFDYVDKRTFLRHIENRLPLYELSFKEAAEKSDIDWRLLAAVGYQESHWNPKATSPTGVRGLMMLTQRTAAQLGVKDRTDPRESIFGGAEYLRQMFSRIPDRIPSPDRNWMGLAAYNVGMGHLEDARILTEKQEKNPDTWVDVKATLPLLSKRKYYKQTKYGYARGHEPVKYVQHIRDYYEILVWYTERKITEELKSLENNEEPNTDNNIKLPTAL